jgi:hypothetical protein
MDAYSSTSTQFSVDSVAVMCGATRLTYAARMRSCKVAGNLAYLDTVLGSMAGIAMEMLSVPIGAANAGEAYVRSDIDPLALRRNYLADAGLSHLLTTKDWKGLFPKIHPHKELLDGDAHLGSQGLVVTQAGVVRLAESQTYLTLD